MATIAEHSSGDAGPVDEMCFILRLYIPTWKKTQCINQTNTNMGIRVHVHRDTHTTVLLRVCVYTQLAVVKRVLKKLLIMTHQLMQASASVWAAS